VDNVVAPSPVVRLALLRGPWSSSPNRARLYRVAPVLALTLSRLIWVTADVATKMAIHAIPPITLATIRFLIAILAIGCLAKRRGVAMAPARVTAPLGLIGVALTFLLQNLGLARTAATNASLLQGAVPCLTLVLAALFLGERLGRRRLAAIAAVMLGVAAITLSSGDSLRMPGLGDALVFASTGCFAAFIVLGRRAFPTYGTLPVLFGMTAWGAAALVPMAGLELAFMHPAGVGLRHIGLVLYLGAGCSALTYGLWGFALCHLEATRAAPFDALIPVIGTVTAVLVLRESPTIWHLMGGVLVIAGIWLTMREPAARALDST
jgi:drug/metabolite transporter (DMT)-like permease